MAGVESWPGQTHNLAERKEKKKKGFLLPFFIGHSRLLSAAAFLLCLIVCRYQHLWRTDDFFLFLVWSLVYSSISVSHCVFLPLLCMCTYVNARLILQIPNWGIREQGNVMVWWVSYSAVAWALASPNVTKFSEIVTKLFIHPSWQLFVKMRALCMQSLY